MKRPVFRAATFAIAGLLLLATLGFVFFDEYDNLSFQSTSDTTSKTPAPAYNDSVKTEPQPVTPEPTNTSTQAASDAPLTMAAIEPDNCKHDMADQERDYEQKTAEEKDLLDSILSFRVGLNISTKYVEDYNKTVTELFNKNIDTAKTKGCTFPVKQPALLPTTYHP